VRIIVKAQVLRRTQDKRYDAGKGADDRRHHRLLQGHDEVPRLDEQPTAKFTR
jgi:hypothetical protein